MSMYGVYKNLTDGPIYVIVDSEELKCCSDVLDMIIFVSDLLLNLHRKKLFVGL